MGLVRNTLDRWLGRSTPLSLDQWASYFNYGGVQYPYGHTPTTTYGNDKQEAPQASFVGYVQGAYRSNGIIFACMLARLSLFSEARFQFRQLRSGRPGDLFGSEALSILETPWPNATTGDLLARAIQDVDLAGNFYLARRGRFLRRMRPDWVTIVLGSEQELSGPLAESYEELDMQVAGYMYKPGGPSSGLDPIPLLPEQVCHFAPIPDPEARFRGMSWLTPIIRELMADNAATNHKLKFFEQGATPNLTVTFDTPLIKTQEQFDAWVDTFRRAHEGSGNAFKTMYLSGGTTVQKIGADMQQVDFKQIQGAGETRIAAAAGVPPVIVGLSEGLQGSALNAGNYQQSFRRFADLTVRPLWRNFCGSVSSLLDVPGSSELWYDDRDIPALKDDVKSAAEVQEIQSRSIKGFVESGFTPESAVLAVVAGDLKLLKHTGLLSVQLTKPGEAQPSTNGAGELPAVVE